MTEGPERSSASATSGGGVSHSGNVTQTVNIPPSDKSGIAVAVVVPIVAALLIGVGGAYAKYRFDLWNAPEKTQAQTNTLLGLVKEILEVGNSKQLPADVTERLKKLERQARAIGANVEVLQKPKGQFSSQADFWLWKNTAGTLGGTTSFGVNNEGSSGVLYVTVNGVRKKMLAGDRIDYKTVDGQTCFVSYIGKFSEASQYGFKIECGS